MIDKFIEEIRQSTGAVPSLEELVPGKWITFPVSGKRGDPKGRCKLFSGGDGGMYVRCDENGGMKWRLWQARDPLTQTDKAAFLTNVEQAKKEAAKIVAEVRAKCREKSAALWGKGRAVDADHPFLVAKGFNPYGVRQLNERLMIPVRDAGGTLHGLQFIAPNGSTQFKAGTVVTGCYHLIGTPNGKLLIVVDWETACTLHQATGHAVAVAFNNYNLKPVAEALRATFPDAHLVTRGDGCQGQTMRAQENSTAEKVATLLNGGIPQKEITELLGITKGAVSKAKKKAVRLSLLNMDY